MRVAQDATVANAPYRPLSHSHAPTATHPTATLPRQPSQANATTLPVCLIKPWTREGLIGSKKYDYKFLCMPSMPWSKGGVEPPMFLDKDEKLPLLLAL